MNVRILNSKVLMVLLLLFLTISIAECSSRKFVSKVKKTEYEIASKTTRSDIINQTVISLLGFNFTIEYATVHALYSAVKTDWRMHSQAVSDYDATDSFQIRDRALLHLSARGFQGRAESMVASKIEFELQIQYDSKWTPLEPDSTFIAEYLDIVDDIKTRIQQKGYQFLN